MSKTKELVDRHNYEHPLGEEHRAELHWMEQEQYERYPNRKDDTSETYDYD